MNTELISFYSDIDNNTYYSDNAYRLREECFRLNIPNDFRQLKSLDDYRLNCLRKPEFILTMLQEKKKPIVWMDIDSKIHKELSAFDKMTENQADLGFAFPILSQEELPMSSPKASPIFCNYNQNVIDFLNTWVQECKQSIEKNEHFFDHEILLMKVFPKLKNMKIGILPINYCIWPNKVPKNIDPYITMGIASGESKEKNLRKMGKVLGMKEQHILFNLNRI